MVKQPYTPDETRVMWEVTPIRCSRGLAKLAEALDMRGINAWEQHVVRAECKSAKSGRNQGDT